MPLNFFLEERMGMANKTEWVIERLYYIEEKTKKNKLIFPTDYTPIGGRIRNITTGDRYDYNMTLIDKMLKLKILSDSGVLERVRVKDDIFEGVKHDESFLDKYTEKKPPEPENDKYVDTRPSWDEYFMANAQLISSRSTCDRLYVGCVIVKENHIVGEGYNGSIAGHPHCSEIGHLMYEKGCKRTIHAEKNALNMCAKLGIPTEGATAYVTHYPCPDCMKELNQAGIKNVIYGSFYQHRYENDFDQGMTLREFKGKRLKIEWVEES
jgi:dCMP deaminase